MCLLASFDEDEVDDGFLDLIDPDENSEVGSEELIQVENIYMLYVHYELHQWNKKYIDVI
jgi:hypothetical protein